MWPCFINNQGRMAKDAWRYNEKSFNEKSFNKITYSNRVWGIIRPTTGKHPGR